MFLVRHFFSTELLTSFVRTDLYSTSSTADCGWQMEKYALVSFLVLLASCQSYGDVCKDLANRIDEREYTFEEVNACQKCEWEKIDSDSRQSYYPSLTLSTKPDMSRVGSAESAWCASEDGGDYLEIKFDELLKVGGLVIQGDRIAKSWVTTYKVSYTDGNEDFLFMKDADGNTKVFEGSDNADSEIERRFPVPVVASLVRIHPITSHISACLKVDVYACEEGSAMARMPPIGSGPIPGVLADAVGCTLNVVTDCGKLRCLKFKKNASRCEYCECEEEKIGALFESDIELTPLTKAAVKTSLGVGLEVKEGVLHGASSKVAKWLDYKSNGKIIVPYRFGYGLSSRARPAIQAAVQHLASKTCIHLVPRSNQAYYINFVSRGGCSSPVGKQYGGNQVSIGYGCENTGTVVHEVLHSLGFWHEQSRPDRDRHVKILWWNIQAGMSYNFQARQTSEVNSFGSPYDLNSVMHYGGTAFSRNGQSTIVPTGGGRVPGQRNGLSTEDIKQVNAMYGCKGTGTGQTTARPTTTRPTKRTTTVAPAICTDNNRDCPYWSRTGECNKNPRYMKVFCKKSCRVCSGGGSCNDKNRNCVAWKPYCNYSQYYLYMTANCPRTCNKC